MIFLFCSKLQKYLCVIKTNAMSDTCLIESSHMFAVQSSCFWRAKRFCQKNSWQKYILLKFFRTELWYALTKEDVLQWDDEIEIMFFSRSPHVVLLLFFIGCLFFLHLLFSRNWTQGPILAWTRLGSSRVTWEEQQETRHIRLARVCQENKGRTKRVVDPDRYFHSLFPFPTS